MQEQELIDLIDNIIKIKSESNNIEIKAAHKGCPEKLYDTLSSFSNQKNGGIIVFGIDEKKDFYICGVYDPNDLIKKVNEQCKQMEPPTRAYFTVVNYKGKNVVSAEIAETASFEKPCYYKGLGKYRGSFIRVGDADELMTESEIYSYDSYKKRIHDDARTVDDNTIKLFNKEKYNKYLYAVKNERPNLSSNVSNEEINELTGITVNGKPTIAAVMEFSNYPQAYFPQIVINATVVPGYEIGDTNSDGNRFTDNVKITGPIDDMINQAVSFVKRNIRKSVSFNEYGQRKDIYEYPLIAIREAVANSLIHRDYSIYSELYPNSITIFDDRIEITNPGCLYGNISVDQLGYTRPEPRNIILIDILEKLDVTENRYSGIPTIRKELQKLEMPSPIFIQERGQFKVIIKKNFEDNSQGIVLRVISFCSTPRSRDEIVKFVGLSKNYVSSKIIQPLVNEGKLKLTIPEKPGSSLQKFYNPSEENLK